jgi:hypothetical protein
MMGLIPAPEPKFKLSNFMKVLGDQAVADPSKVELKVLQQMQQRVLNHEMRNQAAKLTPQERKEKKIKKIREDTSKCVSVAVFVVKDFSNLSLSLRTLGAKLFGRGQSAGMPCIGNAEGKNCLFQATCCGKWQPPFRLRVEKGKIGHNWVLLGLHQRRVM